jgi:hypothetical protein
MRTVLTGRPVTVFERPSGLVQLEVCALSGLLPNATCPYRRFEWFIGGTQPAQSDTLYREVLVDSATGRLADDSTPPERRTKQIALDLPPQAQPWARSEGLTLLNDLLAMPGAGQAEDDPALRLVSPASHSIYRLDPSFSLDAQSLHLEAVGGAGLRQVTLWVDGYQVAAFRPATPGQIDAGQSGPGMDPFAKPPFEAWWPLSAGVHQAWAEAVREDGEQVASPRITFEVLAEEP